MHPRTTRTPMAALPEGKSEMTYSKEQPMGWTWRVETSGGAAVTGQPEVPEFPSRSDAESWLGEVWHDLADAGAGQVTLLEHERVVYGPMSLEAE